MECGIYYSYKIIDKSWWAISFLIGTQVGSSIFFLQKWSGGSSPSGYEV